MQRGLTPLISSAKNALAHAGKVRLKCERLRVSRQRRLMVALLTDKKKMQGDHRAVVLLDGLLTRFTD
jgi:hypothetical protein